MRKPIFIALIAVVCCLAVTAPVMAQNVKLTIWGRDLPDDDPAHAYVKALLAGFQAHMAKPVDMAELVIVVAGLRAQT